MQFARENRTLAADIPVEEAARLLMQFAREKQEPAPDIPPEEALRLSHNC
jgi:hypothetical protein